MPYLLTCPFREEDKARTRGRKFDIFLHIFIARPQGLIIYTLLPLRKTKDSRALILLRGLEKP